MTANPVLEAPTVDDRALWDLWLSQYRMPVVLAADELGIFAQLDDVPATSGEIGARTGLSARSVEALMASLAAQGFVVRRLGRFHLTDVARTYLVPGRQFYWVGRLRGVSARHPGAETLLRVLRADRLGPDERSVPAWERGRLTKDEARASNERMHSHSWPAALGLARNASFEGVERLLDVAGGSGCFAIAIASRYPALRATVAELASVADDARTYIERYACADRVDVHAMNMFDDEWPAGYDAILFSNILHDWDAARRQRLVACSFAALPRGGRIYLHEMLLNETHDGPLEAALFSIVMLHTRGKQLSAEELESLLTTNGFANVQVRHTYAYYSVVTASKLT